MKASDLSDFDIELIKSLANRKLSDTAESNPIKALVETVFECIAAKGMNIVRDDSREATWTVLSKKHYATPTIIRSWK